MRHVDDELALHLPDLGDDDREPLHRQDRELTLSPRPAAAARRRPVICFHA